jgi:two-component system nitrogen regulation response regulator NtrX
VSSERILVVDDEAGVRSSLQGILEDEGYRVDTVESAEAALSRISTGRYDLVLLDIWLPNMDGMEALARIRERDPDAAVIMISGHGTIENAVRAIQLGAYNFVEKPLSLDKTVIAVSSALKQRRLEQENRYLRARVESKQALIGESASMRELGNRSAWPPPPTGASSSSERTNGRSWWPARSTLNRSARTGVSSRSTARRFPRSSSKASSSDT